LTVKRRTTAIIVAGVLALVCAAAIVLYVNNANKRAVAGQEAAEVWVATKEIPRGTSLMSATASLRRELVPIRSAPESAVKMLPTDRTLVAMSDIAAGEILLTGRFSSEDQVGPELLTIPTGRMAISVAMEDANRVGDFVRPGDFVAVFGSVKLSTSSEVRSTKVLFPRVQVLGVGASSEKGEVERTGSKTKDQVTMTLALTSDESALLVSALAVEGYIQFALLPAGESAKSDGSLTDILSKAVR
jgi:pilus assembly protein CpaB